MNGLRAHLDNKEFIDFVKSYDVICLTETHLKLEQNISVFSDYTIYNTDAYKLSKQGRLAGGVIVLIKLSLAMFVEQVNISIENFITIKMKRDLFNLDKDLIYVGCYLPPLESKFWHISEHGFGLEVIEKCILEIYENFPQCYIMICGDLNARTGSLNCHEDPDDFDVLTPTDDESCRRKSQDQGINSFGEQLVELCNMMDYVILNGMCDYSFDDGCTFISDSGSSVIDYFILSRPLLLMLNIKQLTIEDQLESDHLPVSLIVNCKRQSNDPKQDNFEQERVIWNDNKKDIFMQNLETPQIVDLFNQSINYLDALDVDNAIDSFVKGLTKASECMRKTIKKENLRNQWYDKECRDAKINAKKKLRAFRKNKLTEDRLEYVKERKLYKKIIKDKKKQYRQTQCAKLAASTKDSSAFWSEVRKLLSVKRTTDNININVWFDHFEQLFEQEDDNDINNFGETNDLDSNHMLNSRISEEEVKLAVKNLKSGKSGGLDGILSEMLKAGSLVAIPFLTQLFNTIFDKGQYPSQWANGIIIPIYKKGDPENPNNYRGISLLSTISKCFTAILNRRLYDWLEKENKIKENQAGFRKKYSTIDHVFTLHAIVQSQLNKKGRKLYVAFVDFKKAFDNVNHSKLLEVLYGEGVNGKFYNIIKSMYEKLMSCVRTGNQMSRSFKCTKGVRQGCVLSPTLFSVFINQLAVHISEFGKNGIQLLPGLIELFVLLFADDITLISSTPVGLQHQLNLLNQCCLSLKLEVNIDKTKIIVFRKGGFLSKFEKWTYRGVNIEVVNDYCYLGFVFTTMLSFKRGTNHLVSKGKKAAFNLFRLYQQFKEIGPDIFFKIFDSKVQSILMYSSEIWGICRIDSLERVHLLACKRFLGVPLKTPNKMVYGELGRYPLYINSSARTIKYWFKLLDMNPTRLPYQAYHMLLKLDENGKTTWVTHIRQLLAESGFYHVWLHQGVGNRNAFIKVLKIRLQDMFIQEWFTTINGKERYNIFSQIKTGFGREAYIIDIDVYCFRIALTYLRLGVLSINNNAFRYSENNLDRYCPFCRNVVEDESHFLLICPVYKTLRTRFSIGCSHSVINTLRPKSVTYNRQLSKYIFYAYQTRNSLLMNNI